MPLAWNERRTAPGWIAATLGAGLACLTAAGCASPGPPRPPSLNLPQPVHKLSAERTAATVHLEFLVPERTTDHLPVREKELGLHVCRATAADSTCIPVIAGIPETVKPGTLVQIEDRLPVALRSGPAQLLTYRVELSNARGRSAGLSDPAWAAGGAAPGTVAGFRATGSRLGVVLSWQPEPADQAKLIVERLDTTHRPTGDHHRSEQLLVSEDASSTARTGTLLDTSATEDTTYRYVAHRELVMTLGEHKLTLRGEDSAPIEFTLHDVYPPPPPTDLTAAGFSGNGTAGSFYVDLVWEPVEDAGLAGYNLYREADGIPREKLNAVPLTSPSFHDTTAKAGIAYRWSVTAIDNKGNESAPATAHLENP